MPAPSHPTWAFRKIRPIALIFVSLFVTGFLITASTGVMSAGSSPIEQSRQPDRSLFAAAFVPNAGQSDPAVRFELRAAGGTLFFTSREIVLARRTTAMRLRFAAANEDPKISGVDRQPGVVNYLRGTSRAGWRTGLPTYRGVLYRALYPGIDVRYGLQPASGTPWVNATYDIAASADPSRIRWRYEQAKAVSADNESGVLRITLTGDPSRTLVEAAPTAWQEIGGRRVRVGVRYRVGSDGTVSFELARHDRSRPLVIGPAQDRDQGASNAVAGFSTYLGGSMWDEAFDIEVDSAGSVYVAGYTFSPDFPAADAPQPAFRGVMDAFVTKLSADGSTLVFSTFLGGSKVDVAHALALDGARNVYVAGRTESTDFPTANALQPRLRGHECQRPRKHEPAVPCHDAFVTKLSAGGDVRYSTYFGGSHVDEAVAIAVDTRGSAYITGNTESTDLPTRRALQPVFAALPCEGQAPCPSDVFITKIQSSGRALAYSTYLGGKKSERSGGIAVDRRGQAYVTGTTRSTNFPTKRPLQSRLNGVECGPPPVPCPDLFVAKLRRSGHALAYSTYLGGSEPETSGGIAVDSSGNAYLTGSTQSADFPTANAVQPALDNRSCSTEAPPKELCADAFVTKLSSRGRGLRYSTYLSGQADDQGLGIAVDATRSAVVTGLTSSRNFETLRPAQQTFGGYIDAFATRLQPDGRALVFSTFLGGTETERGTAVAADAAGNAYVTGSTLSDDFGTTAGVVQRGLRGDMDAFVTKLQP